MVKDGPLFSVIMPAFDRETILPRAVASVLSQDDRDFELLIIDDASSDGTGVVARAIADPRIRVFTHDRNRGVCPARNTGVTNARGEWCVLVDSDWELLPGALRQLRERVRSVDPKVGNVSSAAVWDDGSVSPSPLPEARQFDFASYVDWIGAQRMSDKLDCIRRVVFERILFPDSRAWELEFHLELVDKWIIDFEPVPRMRVHRDAPNRLTAARGHSAVSRLLRDSRDKFLSFQRVIRDHGERLQLVAPGFRHYLGSVLATEAILAGARGSALREISKLIRQRPSALFSWLLVGAAVTPPSWVARVIVWRRNLST